MSNRFAAVIVAGALLAGVTAATAGPAAAAERRARPNRPADHGRVEQLRLACRPATNGEQRGIGCTWSQSTSPRFAAYRLIRGTDDGRTVVFRTAQRDHTRYLDTAVRRGVRYRYAVLAYDKHDKIIGRSNVVTTGIPAATATR